MKNGLVKNWMTTDVITIEPETKLPDADWLMAEMDIRRLPVIDPKNGRLVGLITSSDIRGAAPSEATTLTVWEISYLINRLEAREFMSTDLVVVAPETTIESAAQLMIDNRIGTLPVIDEETGKLVGIITESDIFRLIVEHGWKEKEKEREMVPAP